MVIGLAYSVVVIAVVFLAAGSVGRFGVDGPLKKYADPILNPACRSPIGFGSRKLPSYDDLVKESEAELCRSFFSPPQAGMCGDLRFLQISGGFTGGTYYFDRRGVLVATEWWSDNIDEICEGRGFRGRRITCAKSDIRNVCSEPQ